MSGAELKRRIDELGISYASITRELGVKPSAITGYFSTDKIRHTTLRRIDNAIRILTGGQYGLCEDTPPAAPVPDAAASGVPAPLPDQQQALDYAARQVATMSRRLSDALTRLEERENVLDKKEARLDYLLETLTKVITAYNETHPEGFPGAEPFIGGLDLAADIADSPEKGDK